MVMEATSNIFSGRGARDSAMPEGRPAPPEHIQSRGALVISQTRISKDYACGLFNVITHFCRGLISGCLSVLFGLQKQQQPVSTP